MNDCGKLLDMASEAIARGQLEEAERLGLVVLQAEPSSHTAQLLMGIIRSRQSQLPEAVELLQIASQGTEEKAIASIWLSRAYRLLGRPEDALNAARIAAEEPEADGAANHQLGMCLLDAGEFFEAVDVFRRALQTNPNVAVLHQGLGTALKGVSRNTEAIQALRRADELQPSNPKILAALCETLLDDSEALAALACARRLVQIQPSGPEANFLLARTLIAANLGDQAEEQLAKLRDLDISSGPHVLAFGALLHTLGHLDEANAQFLRSIAIVPEQGSAYAALTYNRRTSEEDRSFVSGMKQIASETDLNQSEKCLLNYAIGKASEDLGDYEEAMVRFDEANRLAYESKFGKSQFDRRQYSEQVERLMRLLGKDSDNKPAEAHPSDMPIFVVGMLRSGTTLVDQIISSHPKVGSVGEQGYWLHRREAVWNKSGAFQGERLMELAEGYLTTLISSAPGRERVVDKMPDNYLHLPILKMAFPNAKFIHCVRNPYDTCISIYTTINRLRLDWAHNKRNIAFVYHQYERLMRRWESIFTEKDFLAVAYEDLVTHPEATSREIVSFCSLDWHDACLHPEANRRTVSTPSAWQVRQPMYRTSIDRWTRYKPWLEEFEEAAQI